MILLTLRDLQHRLVRFVVVTILAAVVFSLLFLMTGLVEQFHREPVDTVNAFGATTWIVPEGISGPFTAASTLPVAVVGAVEGGQPAVIARSSMTSDGESDEVILVGHTPDGLGAPPTDEGRAATASGEVVVDESAGVDVGETVEVGGEPFQVVGTSSDTTLLAGIPLVFMTLEDAQDLVFRSREVVGVVLSGDVVQAPPGTTALTNGQVEDDAFGPLESAIASVDLVRLLLWLVAAVIIGAVVYLSALERSRDFAVMRAIGAPTRLLMASLALQAVLVALVAVAIAAVLQKLIGPMFPLRIRVPDRAFVQLPVLAVVLALLASAAGLRRVARADPAQAFAGAGG